MIDNFLFSGEGFEAESLLADWRWLIGERPYTIKAIAAIGNLFLEDQDGGIFLLEIEDGTLDRIAHSAEQFSELLGNRHNRTAWLQTFLVRELRRQGMMLGPGQCYGRKTPHVLQREPHAGDLNESIELTDLAVHVSMLGQIHRQVKSMPPGANIDEIRVEPPEP